MSQKGWVELGNKKAYMVYTTWTNSYIIYTYMFSYAEQYISSEYCWLENESLYFGFLLPLGLLLVFNLCVFVLVMVELNGSNKQVNIFGNLPFNNLKDRQH